MILRTKRLNGFDDIGYWYFCENCERTQLSEITNAATYVHNTVAGRRRALREKM